MRFLIFSDTLVSKFYLLFHFYRMNDSLVLIQPSGCQNIINVMLLINTMDIFRTSTNATGIGLHTRVDHVVHAVGI